METLENNRHTEMLSKAIQESKLFAVDALWAIMILILGIIISKIILSFLRTILGRTKIDIIIQNFLVSVTSAALYLLIIIAVLRKLGFETSSLVALIGAAGLAIGLALQSSLQNFAAGFMLIIFKPFKAGDYIDVVNISGIVDKINIFSTTILSNDNKEITVSNNVIYSNTITNYSRRPTRRIDLTLGISYESDLKKARELLQQIIDSNEKILKDPLPLIAVNDLTDTSVSLVVRFWVKTPDYWELKFDITEKIKMMFDSNDMIKPQPQMHVHLKKIV